MNMDHLLVIAITRSGWEMKRNGTSATKPFYLQTMDHTNCHVGKSKMFLPLLTLEQVKFISAPFFRISEGTLYGLRGIKFIHESFSIFQNRRSSQHWSELETITRLSKKGPSRECWVLPRVVDALARAVIGSCIKTSCRFIKVSIGIFPRDQFIESKLRQLLLCLISDTCLMLALV